MFKKILICSMFATLAMMGVASAQTPPVMTQQTANIKRTILQKYDVPGTNYETVVAIAEIVPNVNVGRHFHPGPESGMLLEGGYVLMVEGQPDKSYKAGDSYQIPANTIHDAKTGPNGAKVIAIYVVEKGKPLATPAPK